MREHDAQIVLLVRGFEEADPKGAVLPIRTRDAATGKALQASAPAERHVDLFEAPGLRSGETGARRARLLFEPLAHDLPSLRGLLRVTRLGAGTTVLVAVIALVSGLLGNVLGPERRVNLLSFPLLGVLAWNVAMYLLALGRPVATRLFRDRLRPESEGAAGLAAGLAGWLTTGLPWRLLRGWKLGHDGEGGDRRIVTAALGRFATLWHRCASALLTARVRRALHAGAIAVALGTLGGMYVRGIAFEYQATWESTWLDAPGAQRALDTLLGPAALVLGVEVPDVAPLRGPEGSGPAAPWIHLYAMTVLLFVVVPRSLLALGETARSIRLAANLSVDTADGYFREVFKDWRGSRTAARIVPYSYEPAPASLDTLKELLREVFGARADLQVGQPLEYGDGASELAEGHPPQGRDDGETCHVLLFNAAQSPEAEVHGDLLERAKLVLGEHDRLLVVIDLGPYARRADTPGRTTERMRAWERIARQAGLDAVGLDPKADPEATREALARAQWPPRSADPE